VLAYDTEYAMVDRDDDLKIGMKTSAITLGRFDVAAIMLSYVLFMLIWSIALSRFGGRQALGWPFVAGVLLAVVQAVWHWRLIRHRQRDSCFLAFRMNHWLGFTIFAGIALSFTWGAPA
jgi:4-hydroxybenzoate polyprenyltransferase